MSKLTTEESAQRAEDVVWMAETGEYASGAARRLGITVDALEKWCRSNDLGRQWRALADREPRDWNPARQRTTHYFGGAA